MKNLLLRASIFVFLSILIISAKEEKKIIDAKSIENSVVKISDDLFAGQCEVSNWWYRQFLNDLKANNRNEDLKISQIDSAGWMEGPVYIEPFVKIYHTNPAYDNYPVVNLNYEAAKLFCSWLTDKYNLINGRKYNKVIFFLPSEQQWNSAAKGNTENSVYSTGISLKNKNGLPMANYRRTDIPVSEDSLLTSNAEVLAPVKSYWKNDFGIYNLSGNAAEMISEKGITKGGSFKDTENDLKIESRKLYQKSGSNIGFRYFMQVVSP